MRLYPKTIPEKVHINLPGSKSYTNRALILSALCEGTSVLRNVLFSDDTLRMLDCLTQLGIPIECKPDSSTVVITGHGGPRHVPEQPLYCGNAGTVIRFLAPFCGLKKGSFILTGNQRMQQRPIRDLLDGLRQIGVDAKDLNGTGCPPVCITGTGNIGGTCRMKGDTSSQFFTGMLLSATRMPDGIVLETIGEMVSKPYIDMTIDILEKFGVETFNENYRRLAIFPDQIPQPRDYEIEGDASGASYFLAAAAITGKTVVVEPIPLDTSQGDVELAELLMEMGCSILHSGSRIEITGGQLTGIEADMNGMSDVAQTLGVVALFADGPTTIRNIANARVKETDRIAAMATELRKLGAKVDEYPDGLTIYPADHYHPVEIDTYDDHRMAMSFAVAAIKIPGLIIDNPGCVTKTFPSFFDLFKHWVEQEPI